MCVTDVLIVDLSYATEKVVYIGTSVGPLVSSDPYRIGWAFSVQNGAKLAVSTLTTIDLAGGTPALTAGGSNYHSFGALVQRAWYAVASAAGTPVNVYEL